MFVGDMPGRPRFEGPGADEQLVIWCVRRLAFGPVLGRCAVVEVALARRFGDAGAELGVLLRCLVHALAMQGTQRLVLGRGCQLWVTDDELRLLAAIGSGEAGGLGPQALLGPLLGAVRGCLSR